MSKVTVPRLTYYIEAASVFKSRQAFSKGTRRRAPAGQATGGDTLETFIREVKHGTIASFIVADRISSSTIKHDGGTCPLNVKGYRAKADVLNRSRQRI